MATLYTTPLATRRKQALYALARKLHATDYTRAQERSLAREVAQQMGLTIKATLAEAYRIIDIRKRRRFRETARAEAILRDRQRVARYLGRISLPRMREQGLPTGWLTDGPTMPCERDIPARLWLISGEYQYHYSNRAGDWWTGATYICGRDDGQTFAVRVPRSVCSISEALAYLKPAAVQKAEDEGRWVVRQGDVYLVELKAGKDNLRALPWSHKWDAETRTLQHGEHQHITVPDHVRAVRAYTQISVGGPGTAD